jgi:hypothetical protein
VADAIRMLQPVVDRNPGYLYGNVMLAAAYAAAGRRREAERQAELVRRSFPTFAPETFGSALRDPKLRAKLSLTLKKAGL